MLAERFLALCFCRALVPNALIWALPVLCGQGNNCTLPGGGTNVMAQRNYPCDSQIVAYFGNAQSQSRNATGVHAFRRQLWQCMIAQVPQAPTASWLHGVADCAASTSSSGTIAWSMQATMVPDFSHMS